jgi:hypothetical protein
LAVRIASFDKRAIADTKRLVDVATLPPDTEIGQEWDAFLASFGRPGSQKRISALMELRFRKASRTLAVATTFSGRESLSVERAMEQGEAP